MASVAQRTCWCLLASWCFIFAIVMLKWTQLSTATFRNTLPTTGSIRTWPKDSMSRRSTLLEIQCQIHSAVNCSTALSAVSLSKELVIRRVYFDPRKRDGHSNAAVFLFEASRRVNTRLFSGCRIGTYRSDKFHFRVPGFYKWFQDHRGATAQLAMLDCYDIPQPRNGDSASLFYTSSTSGLEVEVLSLKPLVVPEGRKNSTATVATCLANVFVGEHSPTQYGMIYHWLRYQKTIGVDHVHMIVEDSFVRAGGFHEAYSQQAIREGFLSIDFWPHWLNKTEIYRSQSLAYEDCLYRFQGVYDYVIYCDSDDFFVPVSRNKSIKHYLQTWCGGKTGTCRFQWRQLYPDCGWDPGSVRGDGNLTATVSYKKSTVRIVPKSVHQLKGIVDAGVHSSMERIPGYGRKDVPPSEAYFAHLRTRSRPPRGC